MGLRVTILHPDELAFEEREGLEEQTLSPKPYLAVKAEGRPLSTGFEKTGMAAFPLKFLTVLTPYKLAEHEALASVRGFSTEGWIGVTIEDDVEKTTLYCNLAADGRRMHDNSNAAIGPLATDAFIVSLVRDRTGTDLLRYAIHNGSYLRLEGRILFDSVIKADAVIDEGDTGMEAHILTQPNTVVRLGVKQPPTEVLLNRGLCEEWEYAAELAVLKVRLPNEVNELKVQY